MAEIKIVSPSVKIVSNPDGQAALKLIERMGRISHQSQDFATEDSAEAFVRKIIKMNHLSLLEHYSLSAIFICSRGVADELRTHRLTSPIMESTRWCDYNKGNDLVMTFVRDDDNPEHIDFWDTVYINAIENYKALREHGVRPEIARDAIPLGIKAEFGITANLRQWRYIINLRTKRDCHPQMRFLMKDFLRQAQEAIPVVFDDLKGAE